MQVQLSAADYLEAVRLGIKPRPALAVVGVVLVVLALFPLAWVAQRLFHGQVRWNEVVMVLALGWTAVWYWLYIPWQVNKLFRQQRSLQEPYTVSLEQEGLRFRTSNGEALLPWKYLLRWRESRSIFCLYQSDALVHVLPKRFFDSLFSEEAFRNALLQNAGPSNKAVTRSKP